MGIVIILIFFAVAWFLLIVPRKRELRRHGLLMTQLQPGDEVVMSSGVYGTIRSIEGDEVRLEVAPGVELKIAKRAIATLAVDPNTVSDASVVDLTDDDLRNGPNGPERPDVAGA
jgi:preprotein translocase subunit YajC